MALALGLTLACGGGGSTGRANPYNPAGFDTVGRHRDTGTRYDPAGYDINGYNADGFNAAGNHRDTNTPYNPAGFDRTGFNVENLARFWDV